MGKLVNERTAAKLIGKSHRQMVRWRKNPVKGKNPPYYVIDGQHWYDIELLDMWLQTVNALEIERKLPRRKQTVFQMGGVKFVDDNLIEGEQVYIPKGALAQVSGKAATNPAQPYHGLTNNWCGQDVATFIDEGCATHIMGERR